jgi:hypothetical protein
MFLYESLFTIYVRPHFMNSSILYNFLFSDFVYEFTVQIRSKYRNVLKKHFLVICSYFDTNSRNINRSVRAIYFSISDFLFVNFPSSLI